MPGCGEAQHSSTYAHTRNNLPPISPSHSPSPSNTTPLPFKDIPPQLVANHHYESSSNHSAVHTQTTNTSMDSIPIRTRTLHPRFCLRREHSKLTAQQSNITYGANTKYQRHTHLVFGAAQAQYSASLVESNTNPNAHIHTDQNQLATNPIQCRLYLAWVWGCPHTVRERKQMRADDVCVKLDGFGIGRYWEKLAFLSKRVAQTKSAPF